MSESLDAVSTVMMEELRRRELRFALSDTGFSINLLFRDSALCCVGYDHIQDFIDLSTLVSFL